MIPLTITITNYREDLHDFEAMTDDGKLIIIDPFVSDAILVPEEGCKKCIKQSYTGVSYLLTGYSVYPAYIIPHVNGMNRFRGFR